MSRINIYLSINQFIKFIRKIFLFRKYQKVPMETNIEIPDDLENLSKEELLSLLKSIKNKEILKEDIKNKEVLKESKNKKSAIFDFSRYSKRHVALKFLYLGWDYSGFATQMNTEQTIEAQVIKALEKTKLLECRETSNYQRCGRTDKGVSAFSQVVSLDLRSNLLEGKGVLPLENKDKIKKTSDIEIDYSAVLNRVLPPEIKVIAWAPVDIGFSARFDCTQRTYKYWFPIGKLNIEKMRDAAQSFVGEHDFRNFCKMDVANGIVNYVRKIRKVNIQKMNLSETEAYDIAELTIVGNAFLYHQIRCIMSVLCLIGLGREEPEVVKSLLDVSSHPRKPQYKIAFEIPLVLFECCYDDLEWIYCEDSIRLVIQHLQNLWAENAIKSVILRSYLKELEKLPILKKPVISQAKCLMPGEKLRHYKRLLERPCCESLEDRLEHYNKRAKRKLKEPVS